MAPPGPVQTGKKDLGNVEFERIPFYGTRVPPNIGLFKKIAPKLERTTLQKLIRLALSSTEGKTVKPAMFEALVSPNITIDTVHIIYAGALKIIQMAFRCSSTSLPVEHFTSDLKSLNLGEEIISDLSAAIYGSRRSVLETATIKNVPKHVTITDFKWKIDVAISTTSLNRVLEPSVSVRMTLSNGEVKCFEMTVAKFQELRYNVASVMKEMEHLEKRSILKIQD